MTTRVQESAIFVERNPTLGGPLKCFFFCFYSKSDNTRPTCDKHDSNPYRVGRLIERSSFHLPPRKVVFECRPDEYMPGTHSHSTHVLNLRTFIMILIYNVVGFFFF